MEGSRDDCTLRPSFLIANDGYLPTRSIFQTKPSAASVMAVIAVTNALSGGKPTEGTILGNKKRPCKSVPKDTFPPPLKSVEEVKRRITFLRSTEAPKVPSSIGQETL